MHLLDSDIATLVYYGRNQRVRTRYESYPDPETLALSTITRAEILRGRLDSILKASTPEQWIEAQTRLNETESWLSGFEIIAVDAAAATRFEQLVAQKKYKKSGRADLLAACIALAHDATLVTRNTKDFATVPGLKLEN